MMCLGMTELTCSSITHKQNTIPSFCGMIKGSIIHQHRQVTQITVDLLEDGSEVKYVNIIRRIPGSLHKQNTKTFAAIIPSKREKYKQILNVTCQNSFCKQAFRSTLAKNHTVNFMEFRKSKKKYKNSAYIMEILEIEHLIATVLF